MECLGSFSGVLHIILYGTILDKRRRLWAENKDLIEESGRDVAWEGEIFLPPSSLSYLNVLRF